MTLTIYLSDKVNLVQQFVFVSIVTQKGQTVAVNLDKPIGVWNYVSLKLLRIWSKHLVS